MEREGTVIQIHEDFVCVRAKFHIRAVPTLVPHAPGDDALEAEKDRCKEILNGAK